MMKKALIIIGIAFGIFVFAFSLRIIDIYVYPFKSVHPNFSDVERAYNKIEIPSEWKQISSSENKGLHGRACDPLSPSGCFHKRITFKVSDIESAKKIVRENFLKAGCVDISEEVIPDGSGSADPKTASNIRCYIGNGLSYSSSVSQRKGQVSVGVVSY